MLATASTSKVTTRESILPRSVQKRLAQLRALVDDYESVRSNLQKRMNGVMPDEVLERAEIDKRLIANNANLSYAKGLLNSVDQWLRASGAVHHVAPTPLKEASFKGKLDPQWGRIENIRTEVARIVSDIFNTKRAPLPLAEIERRLKATVSDWARQGAPTIEVNPLRGDVSARWGAAVPASYKIMAWLDPDAMLAKLVAQAKQQSEINKMKPMFAEEKVIALDQLVVRKFELECEEVAIIDALQDAGHADARHRHDIDPAALLGVKEPKGLMRVV